MAVQTITYEDKQYLNQNADIPATNKVQDTDMNEIKTVVNNNANILQETTTYSTTETNTGKTWIDGKPIFRKVIETNVSANSTGTEDLTNIDYDKIWINDNSFNNYNVTGSAKVNWYNGSNDYGLVYINTSKILNIKNMSSVPRTYYIIIEYTKAS